MVEFLDAAGRSVLTAGPFRYAANVDVGRQVHGFLFWRITIDDDLQRTGRVHLP
jgi:hypothetical protein